MSGYNKRRSGSKNPQFFPAWFWHFRWILKNAKEKKIALDKYLIRKNGELLQIKIKKKINK